MTPNYPVCGLALLALAGCNRHNGISDNSQQSRPNVIMIYADDMGKGMLSVYGQRHFTTPNIDRLVEQGTSFSRAYGCMLSAPARASLLTGYHDCHTDKWSITRGSKYIGSYGADTSAVAAAERAIDNADRVLPEGDLYLAEVFKKAGYYTAQIGKLEYGFTATRRQMHRHGWDYWYGYLDHVRCHGYYPPFLFDRDSIVLVEGNTRANCGKTIEPESAAAFADRHDMSGKVHYSQDLFDQKITDYIRSHKSEPFFLFHPTQLPHGPVAVPAVYPELEADPDLTPIEKEYASMVKRLDETVGAIMQCLQDEGIADRTVIIFASDNGHEIYYSQQGRCEKPYRNMVSGERFDDYRDKYRSSLSGDRFDGNMGMAGLKRSNLDGGAHIPLVIYMPSRAPRRCDQLVSLYDLVPTFADMFDVGIKATKDGVSILPLIGVDGRLSESRYVVCSSYIGPSIVDNSGWKLRHYAPANRFELYNLNDDPQEFNELSDKYPEQVERLKKILIEECRGDLSNGICRN